MTSAADGGPQERAGRYRPITVILALSVALNLFFVAGAAWTRLHAPRGWPERHREMLADLDLDPKQRAAFDDFVAAVSTNFAQMRREIGPLMGSAWAELAKPQANEAQVVQRVDEVSEKRRAFLHDAATRTIEFLALLSPEQRVTFTEIARDRPHARIHRANPDRPSPGAK